VDESRGAAWTRALLGVQARALHICGSADPPGLQELLHRLALDCGDATLTEAYERMTPLVLEGKPLGGFKDIKAGDCVICFTRHDVLLTKAELENLGMSASTIYGSLPPDVRRDQAALFNDPASGYDVLVASDAIGMGLNLQIRRIVFRSLRKFDGETTRCLTAAEIRQISGRAGRYGGRYGSCGLVACFTVQDHEAVSAALDEDGLPPSTLCTADAASFEPRAALFPLPEHLEAFSRALEADVGRPLPFGDLVERFLAIAKASPRYFLSRARHMLSIAGVLTDVYLPPGEKFVLCQTPVSDRDTVSLAALHNFACCLAKGGCVPFPASDISDVPIATTGRGVLELEQLHKLCDIYVWLALRFPDAFSEHAAARAVRQLATERIGQSLRLPLDKADLESPASMSVWEGLPVSEDVMPDEALME